MNQPMKILIAYDDSECARAALEDLKRAGLPDKVEAHVLSVYEAWLPGPGSYAMIEINFRDDLQVKDTLASARRAADTVKSSFPEWEVHAEADAGSPASHIVRKADELKSDLIIVGSHGRSALGRFLLGSVSQGVIHAAHCTVRVGRSHDKESGKPVRLIVGVDGSEGSSAAVKTVSGRHWPQGSEVRIVHGIPAYPPISTDYMSADVANWIESEKARVEEMIEHSVSELNEAGLNVSTVKKKEDPKYLLLSEAEDWKADCIFVGARGMGALDRFLLGSVSSAITARAHCSVEVVRGEPR
jgi:nucleotide-binding universal stress UspA family protein